MNYILITNIDGSGMDELVCDSNLDECDIWLMLTEKGRKFDDVRDIERPPTLPKNTTLSWFTERGEYDIRQEIASHTPELAGFYPEWETLHPPRCRR